MERKGNKKLHVVALPYPAQGHIHPMMVLCRELARKGCKVTFVNTQSNHDRIINSFHQKGANLNPKDVIREKKLDISLVSIAGGEDPGLHENFDALRRVFEATYALQGPFGELVEKLLTSDEEGPHFVLSDVFMSWSRIVAEMHGIPFAGLATCSIAANSTFFNMHQILQEAFCPNHDKTKDGVMYIGDENKLVTSILGLPPMRPHDMAFTMPNSVVRDAFYHLVDSNFKRLFGLPWILANSFMELEKSAIEGLAQYNVNVQPIGPLIPYLSKENNMKVDDHDFMLTNLWEEDMSCLEWLKGKEEGSVLYISFGSIVTLSKEQFEELALGIEASQQVFIWVARDNLVKGHEGLPTPFPSGFLDRTRGRGLVVTWCPQIKVLSNKAIGGFLAHCGWNSTLESITMGVPLLCFPDIGERRINARYIVDVWKVGLEFQCDNEGLVSKEEVERVVLELMRGKCGDYVRQQAIQLSKVARKEREENGTVFKTLDLLIEDMKQKVFQE